MFGRAIRKYKGEAQGQSIMRMQDESAESVSVWQPEEKKHIVEAISDSNFVNCKTTRRSLSSGQVHLDRALAFSFVRSQKVATLSSGEAGLVALTQAVGESVLIRNAFSFVCFVRGQRPEDIELVARTDSSVARAIASRSGVGRVKHLSTSCLWLQGWVSKKLLRRPSIPTVGTKLLPA